MKDFDLILEDCLEKMESGASSLEECLLRYPDHASQLRPLLGSATRLQQTGRVKASPEFKQRARAQLVAHMQSHPQGSRPSSPFLRVAFSLAILVLAFLITGTALAQSALPGETLYNWKLASESAWRAVSPDPLGTDLALADRRVSELVALAGDPKRSAVARELYRETLDRLKSEGDTGAQVRILAVLKVHQSRLAQAGVSIPELDAYIRETLVPGTVPASPSQPTSIPAVGTPALGTAVPELPVLDTAVPETPALPEIMPTVQVPDLKIPTIEVPPPIR